MFNIFFFFIKKMLRRGKITTFPFFKYFVAFFWSFFLWWISKGGQNNGNG